MLVKPRQLWCTLWGKDAVDLLAEVLQYEPAERCTAAQALAMPFLA